ncbi:hypothetical protein GLW20_01655 [Virgibacillus halodenitrificans]|nr:hypothetical protein [Virgibacillus halodenitrificans]
MKLYSTLDANGHLTGAWYPPSGVPDEIEVEVPKDHEAWRNAEVFKFENGTLIKDTAYQQQLINEEQAKHEQPSDDEMNAIAIMELTKMIMGGGV